MLKDAYYALGAGLAKIEHRRPLGRSIYDCDAWDVCIVLDACRVDLWRDVAAEHDLPAGDAAWSVGSVTTEWLTNTFRPLAVGDTTLVSASPHTESVFERRQWLTDPTAAPLDYATNPAAYKRDFDDVHEVWRTHAGGHGVVKPETMLDATMEAYERADGGRVVSHWLQPHEPFIAPETTYRGGAATAKNVWDDLRAGEVPTETVWQAYRENLSYALEFVASVVEHVEGTVLITSDHGNAFGEAGQWGHPFGWPHPSVRKVPWVLVDGKGWEWPKETSILEASCGATDREEQLDALGYV